MTEADKANGSEQDGSNVSASTSSAVTSSETNASPVKQQASGLAYKLKSCWAGKKGSSITKINNELTAAFNTYSEPAVEFLDLLNAVMDQGGVASLSYHVVKQFMSWPKSKSKMAEGGFKPDKDLQLRALIVASKAHYKDVKSLVFSLYNLVDSPDLLPVIMNTLKKHHSFVQVFHWVCLYHVENELPISEYLYPLLLTKNCLDIIQFLDNHGTYIQELIKFADSVFNVHGNLKNLFIANGIMHPKKNQLDSASLNIENLIRRCLKKFNITMNTTPNFYNKTIENEIIFYVQSMNRNDMSEDSFKERVEPLCQDNEKRQKFIVLKLAAKTKSLHLAEYYSKLYGFNLSLPSITARVELKDDYHHVDNLLDMIKFVDCDESISALLQYIDSLSNCGEQEDGDGGSVAIPVGLDTEWKCICGINVTRPPALLQIAFEKIIYLVDVAALYSKTDFWQLLYEKLLMNSRFLKLGYGLKDDQCKFAYYPNLSFFNLDGNKCIDLRKEEIKYRDCDKVKFPFDAEKCTSSGTKSMKGLSRLVAQCYSDPLDKREQLSDWEKRPLRPAQMCYAAMDAYCLIQVYKVLKNMHQQSGIKFTIRHDSAGKFTYQGSPYTPEAMKVRRPFFNKRKIRFFKKKIHASTQASVSCREASTQT